MSASEMSHMDLEQVGCHRLSVSGSDFSAAEECLSDSDTRSCYSQFYSVRGGSYDEYSFGCVSDAAAAAAEMMSSSRRDEDDYDDDDYDSSVGMESEVVEIKVHLDNKMERDCRICHLGLESFSHESGVPIVLGCSCKGDLGAAHKHCAETWFKIKENKTCEICHSIAHNVSGPNVIELIEHPNDNAHAIAIAAVTAQAPSTESRSFWQGRRFLNFLLACMVFAFVISWLFHFNVPSS